MKIIKVLPLLFFGIYMIMLLLGRVRFGKGLGDLFYYPLILVPFIIYLIIYFTIQNEKLALIFTGIFLGIAIYVFLKTTFLRGPEYSWDGDIFAPTYKTKLKRKKEADLKKIKEFNEEIEKNPGDYTLRVKKGFLLRSRGKYKEAIEVFKIAQKISPDEYRAYWEAGYAFNLLKDYPNAVKEYEKAYKTDTTNATLKNTINSMKQRHNIE